MGIPSIVKKISNGEQRKEEIDKLEKELIHNIDEASKYECFFKLPLNNILSIISKVDFTMFDEKNEALTLLNTIVIKTIQAHFEEKETVLILQSIDLTDMLFTYDEIFSILEKFTNCPILKQYCQLYNENQSLPEKDRDYEIKQKDLEIQKLRRLIKNAGTNLRPKTKIEYYPIRDFESDIFQACKYGKLTSVMWLVEKGIVDKNKRVVETDYNDKWKYDTPIHIASKNGHLPIVQYLIETQKVNINIKGNFGKTPLHYACLNGYRVIARYLISKGANIEAKETYWERTPLHYAADYCQTHIVKYLMSKGANKMQKINGGLNHTI